MQEQVLHNKSSIVSIANKNTKLNPIVYSLLVDTLLEDCSDLIDPKYRKWFAARFYQLSPNEVQQAASEARQDARKSPQRLFTHLINKKIKGLK